jgi:hypothetical protein
MTIDAEIDAQFQTMQGLIQNGVSSGTLAPVDTSGAGLVFTNASLTYHQTGPIVFISGKITFPATASTAAASFGNLAVPAGASVLLNAPYGTATNGTAVYTLTMNPNSGVVQILNQATLAPIENTTLASTTLHFTLMYPVL